METRRTISHDRPLTAHQRRHYDQHHYRHANRRLIARMSPDSPSERAL